MKNYYEILEIGENASPEIIEKAYKTLAKKYHPDIQPKDKLYWAEIQMKEINEAYNILSNPVSKRDYDMQLNFKNNINYEQEYNNLYSEHENLKRQIQENISNNNYQDNRINKKTSSSFAPSSMMHNFHFSSYYDTIKSTIYNEVRKPRSERKKDFIAIVLTILIMLILVLMFWKIPFLNKIISF